jgi:hypothetical protein
MATPPKRAAAPLIRHNTLAVPPASRLRLLPPAGVSLAFHAVLLGVLMLLLPGLAPAVPLEEAPAPEEATVLPEPPPEPARNDPFTIEAIDPAELAPDLENTSDADRKADVTVHGVVNPDEPLGVRNGSETAPPVSLPLSYGTGGGNGSLGPALLGPGGVGEGGGDSLSALRLQDPFRGRSAAARKRALEKGGGTGESEVAVNHGLTWLIRVQSPDGRWMLDGNFKNKGQANDIAGTAFGLLPFLGAGKTHKAAKDNPWDKPIERAILFLLRRQDRKNGNLGGGMYGHCLATIALSEAYGLTQDPVLRRPTQMAVNYIVAAQHAEGGWRYSPGERGDTSVSGWAIMALKSAKMGGLDVPDITFRKAVRYLDGCCDPGNDGYGYTGPGSTPTMSAVGLLCRQYLQAWGPNNPRMIKGIKNNIKPTMPPAAGSKPVNMYYYYYATQVMHHFGGDEWKAWNDRMRESIIKSKDQSGSPMHKGSWDPSGDPHAGVGGRLMYTSLCLLTLEVYYRHLPLYYRGAGERREKLLAGS